MTLPPEDDHPPADRPLTEFLQQHRLPAPPAAPELEDRLMAAIDRAQKPQRSRSRPVVWLIPPAIAAGLVATLLGYHTLAPAQLTASETANLEAFLETNWQSAVTDAPEDPFLPASDSTRN